MLNVKPTEFGSAAFPTLWKVSSLKHGVFGVQPDDTARSVVSRLSRRLSHRSSGPEQQAPSVHLLVYAARTAHVCDSFSTRLQQLPAPAVAHPLALT